MLLTTILSNRMRCVASIVFMTLSACASTPSIVDTPSPDVIGPISMPISKEGMVYYYNSALEEGISTVELVSIDSNGDLSFQSDDGCSWTRPSDPHAPELRWENCKGDDGSEWTGGVRTINSKTGELWPLRPGNKSSYRSSTRSRTGGRVEERRDCEVHGAFIIDVDDDKKSAMKVICTDDYGSTSRVRTWYWTSDIGLIKYIRSHSEHGIERHLNYTSKTDG